VLDPSTVNAYQQWVRERQQCLEGFVDRLEGGGPVTPIRLQPRHDVHPKELELGLSDARQQPAVHAARLHRDLRRPDVLEPLQLDEHAGLVRGEGRLVGLGHREAPGLDHRENLLGRHAVAGLDVGRADGALRDLGEQHRIEDGPLQVLFHAVHLPRLGCLPW
jgi:hypothetical protein